MKHILLLLTAAGSLVACSKLYAPFHAAVQPPPTKECTVPTGVPATTRTRNSPNSKLKLAASPFVQGEALVHLNLASSETVPAGTELSVLIDEACALRTGKTWPGFQSRRTLANAEGKVAPFKVKLERSLKVHEIESMAAALPCVRGVGPNLQMELFQARPQALPNDPLVGEQHHLTAIHASEGYDIFFGEENGINQEVVIAIIDTGLQMNHEDILDNLWVNPNETPGNGIDDDGNGYIDDVHGYNFADNISDTGHQTGTNPFGSGHGTPVAGLAAAVGGNQKGVAGVMHKHVKVMPLVAFDKNGRLDSVHVEQAIRYAADQGAQVANLSLGIYEKLDTMGDAIAYAINKGTTIVAAAGNSNAELTDTKWVSPASYGKQYPGAISVGSTKSRSGGKCSESNHSTQFVEIGSPGCDGIYTIQSGNSASYGSFGGTSSASPNAAGSSALIYGFIKSRTGEFPTPDVVERHLRETAREESNLTTLFSGGKHIDLGLLAAELDRLYPPPPPEPEPGLCP